MSASLVLVVTLVACSHHVMGIPLANFYPFGNTAGDNALPRTLDGPSGPITLSTPFIFFDQARELIFVSLQGMTVVIGSYVKVDFLLLSTLCYR